MMLSLVSREKSIGSLMITGAKDLREKEYDEIHYKKGYPKNGDMSKTLVFPYNGYAIKTITHKHFGQEPVKVFAIFLRNLS